MAPGGDSGDGRGVRRGILLRGDLEATPLTNATFLAVGTAIASFIGTTGASMLLIRPLLQTNRERQQVRHTVISFIFLVSNIGGMLTPLGDPPLFLGYLQGVPFAWTFRLWPWWLFMSAVLLVIYFVWDTRVYARETPTARHRDRRQIEPLRVRGALNAVGLGASFSPLPSSTRRGASWPSWRSRRSRCG